jgi:hypothetical protein
MTIQCKVYRETHGPLIKRNEKDDGIWHGEVYGQQTYSLHFTDSELPMRCLLEDEVVTSIRDELIEELREEAWDASGSDDMPDSDAFDDIQVDVPDLEGAVLTRLYDRFVLAVEVKISGAISVDCR